MTSLLTPRTPNCYTFLVSTDGFANVKKIGILYHPKVAATRKKAGELEKFLKAKGITTWLCSAWDREKACRLLPDTDLLLTVGGDGTILRAVQAVIPGRTPITGINLGKLGFMTEFDAGEAQDKLPLLLEGKGWLDERAMLQAEVVAGGEKQVFHALNDAVLARGEIVRLIRVDVSIDGEPFSVYKTDAIIAATATGSTGYALAARGPIIYPQSSDILLVPVAPHLSLPYPLVLPEKTVITLRLSSYHPAVLSIDGHVNIKVSDGDVVTVRRSPHVARFRRVRPRGSFFNFREAKLRGK
jgi:NAD+ kinase